MSEYKLESFKRVEASSGAIKKVWYEYIIASNENTITGCRAGSYHSVFDFVMDCIVSLNQRYKPIKSKELYQVKDTGGKIDFGTLGTNW